MKILRLNIVRLGPATVLARDLGGYYTEIQIYDALLPTVG